MKTIRIDASRSYDVAIGSGLLKEAGERTAAATGAGSAVVVSDDTVFPLYGETVCRSLERAGIRVTSFVFPHGEKSKTLETYGRLLEAMCGAHLTRADAAVALGGGVTGDLTGFAAATYQRGVAFVQLPTTLLAAVDASVGGKTAVDLRGGKNQAGCFYQPSLVLCDTDALRTLPEEEYRCGCAEIVKYAMIGSETLFEELLETPVSERAEEVIGTCVAMKRDYVMEDEFDTGARMMLNFGHTLGHAVEACSGYTVLHGQAVAMGMAAVTRAAAALGVCGRKTSSALAALLKQYGLPTEIPYGLDEMLAAARLDKKAAGSSFRLIVPERIGKCRVETVDAEGLRRWMEQGGVR